MHTLMNLCLATKKMWENESKIFIFNMSLYKANIQILTLPFWKQSENVILRKKKFEGRTKPISLWKPHQISIAKNKIKNKSLENPETPRERNRSWSIHKKKKRMEEIYSYDSEKDHLEWIGKRKP